MREACLIVKTHLGHPGAAKSKEVVSGALGWDAQPLPTAPELALLREEPAKPGSTPPQIQLFDPGFLPETPKPMWTQAMPSMGLGSSGSCLHPPPLEQRFCSPPPGLAAQGGWQGVRPCRGLGGAQPPSAHSSPATAWSFRSGSVCPAKSHPSLTWLPTTSWPLPRSHRLS